MGGKCGERAGKRDGMWGCCGGEISVLGLGVGK